MEVPKSLMTKKENSKGDKPTLAELNLAHRHSQTKCELVQTSYINKFNCYCLQVPCNKILLTKLSWSVWENLDLGHGYRPHCGQSVLTTSVNILS